MRRIRLFVCECSALYAFIFLFYLSLSFYLCVSLSVSLSLSLSGASITPEATMHFPLFQISPPIYEKFLRLRRKFFQFDLFPLFRKYFYFPYFCKFST